MIEWFEKNRVFSVILFVLIAVEIFFFSSITGKVSGPWTGLKVSMTYHFSVFFLLNFFLMVSLNGGKNEKEKNGVKIKYLIIAAIFSVVYSLLDEIHQLFVPFRYADLRDILTNNAGIFLSILVYTYSKNSWKH